MIRSLCMLPLLAAGAVAQEGWFEDGATEAVLPLVLTGDSAFAGVPLVALTMDGHELRFVLDTGFNSIAIDRRVARRLDLEVRGHDVSVAVGGVGRVPLYRCPEFSLGAARFEATVVYGMSTAQFGRGAGIAADGILGSPFFDQFAVVLDYPGRTITLIDPLSFTPPEGAVALPVAKGIGQPLVEARIGGGEPRTFMFDTGAAPNVILYEPFVERLGAAVEGLHSSSIYGFAGQAEARLGTIPSLRLGGLSFAPVPMVVLARPESFGIGANAAQAGILGTGLLTGCRVTIAYPRRSIFLEQVVDHPTAPWPVAFGRAEGVVRISAVVGDGDGLDLNAGDEVLEVAGEPVPESLDALRLRLSGLEEVALRLRRDAREWTVTVRRQAWPELVPADGW